MLTIIRLIPGFYLCEPLYITNYPSFHMCVHTLALIRVQNKGRLCTESRVQTAPRPRPHSLRDTRARHWIIRAQHLREY